MIIRRRRLMVTFSDLIAFTLMIATIIKIVYDITKNH